MEPGLTDVSGGPHGRMQVSEAIHATDLSETSLGPIASWPPGLGTAANICLTSRFPMVLWWGPEMSMVYNDAFVPLIGDKHPSAIGQPGAEVFPEIWDVIGPMLQRVRDRGEATWSEDQLLVLERHGFPEECYFTFSFSPVRDDDGAVAGVFTAITETTDRVFVDRRLRTLGLLAEHTRDATTVHEAGEGAIRALGEVREDLPFALLYLADDDTAQLIAATGLSGELAAEQVTRGRDEDPWQLHAVMDAAEARVMDLPGTPDSAPAANGRARQLPRRAMAHPLMDAGTGQAAGVLVLGISAQRAFDDEYRGFLALVAGQTAKGVVDARAAEVERERLAALAELNRAKTEFFSNVSHEFRTPLTLLQGPLLEALADQEQPLPAPQRRRLEMANRNADRMGKLVNTLLDFSRLESGRINASYQATDLTALTRELSSHFPSAIDQAGLAYEVDLHPLPHVVHVDQEMWAKIVFNLLSNAIKFTFEGHIRIRLDDGGDHAEFVVEDTGVGIPDEEMPHLFARFHRIRGSRARSQEGTGIGLALVKELVDLHGGRIEVTSAVDRGTRFTIALPYGSAHLPEEQIGPEPTVASTAVAASAYVDEAVGWTDEQLDEQARAADPGETGGAHILVVDDNADMRTYLGRLLSAHWRVDAVANGDEALALAGRRRPDLILSDVMMPGLDGFELLETFRQDPALQDIPFVLLSARASEASRVEGLDGGADDYLVKPFTVAELVARIRTNLRLAEQRAHTADVRARQAMLAGLSHEMQTPLAAILGSIAVVEQEPGADDVTTALDIMRRQARQLRGLVQQFLDFSRFEADREPVLQIGPIDPVEVASRAIEVNANPRLHLQTSELSVPKVRADADRVEQIINNLCTNALKFSPHTESVVVAVREQDEAVVIEVRDKGAGIPAEEAELVFEKFYRGRSGDAVDGTGLGLYVGRALAEAMGGTLQLHGDDGQGATFALTLPVA